MGKRGSTRVCGECLTRYPFRYAKNMFFYPDVGMYLCNRCWEKLTELNHSEQRMIIKHTPWNDIFNFIIYSMMILPLMIFSTIDIGLGMYWNSLDVTDVQDLPDSGFVKIYGKINESNDSVIIGIHEVSLEYGYTWEFDQDGGEFNFCDDTGSINISWYSWYDIERGTHPQKTKHGDTGYVYLGGDTIMIIGWITTKHGEKTIDLWYASPEKTEISNPIIQYILTVFTWTVFMYIFSIIMIKMRKYRNEHEKSLGKRCDYNISKTNSQKMKNDDTEENIHITWYNNRGPSSLILQVLLSISIHLLFIYSILFVLRGDYHESTYWEVSGLFLLFWCLLFIPMILIWSWDYVPTHIGASKMGIHWKYENPHVSLFSITFIPWKGITRIGRDYSSESKTWEIRREGREPIDLDGIKKKNCRMMLENWRSWRDGQYVLSSEPDRLTTELSPEYQRRIARAEEKARRNGMDEDRIAYVKERVMEHLKNENYIDEKPEQPQPLMERLIEYKNYPSQKNGRPTRKEQLRKMKAEIKKKKKEEKKRKKDMN